MNWDDVLEARMNMKNGNPRVRIFRGFTGSMMMQTYLCRGQFPDESTGGKSKGEDQVLRRLELFRKVDARKAVVGPRRLFDAGEVDEVSAALHERSPWLDGANIAICESLRRNLRRGYPGWRFEPTLLVGPPGCGKSHFARAVSESLGTPLVTIGAGGRTGFAVQGLEAGWGTAQAGDVVAGLAASEFANMTVFVDEIDKEARHSNAGGVSEALLTMIEHETAARWKCPFLRVEIDLRHLSFIIACNDLSRVPGPLRSRCRIVYCEQPGRGHAAAAVAAVCRSLKVELLEEAEAALIARVEREGLSLRAIAQLAAAAGAVMSRPRVC